MKNTCEKCSMEATFLKAESDGLVHYYCDHHATEGAMRIGETPELKPESSFKKFLPLIIIFSVIFLFTLITSIYHGPLDVQFSMRMMMGSFFAIFGLFKIFNLRAFVDGYSTYDILAKRSRTYAFIYPFLEILIAFLYLTNTGGLSRDIFTFVLMTVSTIGVIQKIREKEVVPCACLGMVFKIPMTWVTLIEDLVMALEAFFMILMTLGLPLIYADNTYTFMQVLKIHPTAELVQLSEIGHWVIGGLFIIIFITSILERFKINYHLIFSKYILPMVLILIGLNLSILSLYHAINDPDVVWYLITHVSQFGQHFWIGILLLVAGIVEWIRTHKNKQTLVFVLPTVIFLIGITFFFHQQLGVISSVRESMNWHMFFGALLIIGATFRILDILFFEEKKFLFTLWLVAILIGSGMMTTYHEPDGSYQLPANSGVYCSSDGILTNTMPIQSHRSYCLKADSSGKTYSVNAPNEYSFSIVDDQGNTLKDFAITHTKPMHVIVARKDLAYFQHVHPEYDTTTGAFSFKDLTFPALGTYRIFADFAPSGGQKDAIGMPLVVTISEDVPVGVGTNYTPKALGSEEKTKTFNGYQVALSSDQALISEKEVMLTFKLKQNDKPITDLEEYLDALGHTVVLREGTLDFIHAHPMEGVKAPQTGKVDFMVYFPEAGRYKVFTQFQRSGKVFTTNFVVTITQGSSSTDM